MSKLSEEDKSLFASAIEGAKPITRKDKVFHRPSQISATQAIKQNQQADLTDNSPFSTELDTSSQVSAFESLQFQVPSLQDQTLIKLKKGRFATQWHLDLHGMIESEADQALKRFLAEAIAENQRYLIIVHGKGYNSDLTQPILKNLVNTRLRQVPQVLAFCSAQPKDGGTGAVYVLLKKTQPD